jgi:hypothetical protein
MTSKTIVSLAVFCKQLFAHPHRAIASSMVSPRPLLFSLIFILICLAFSNMLMPTIMSGSHDSLQSTSLSEHLSPEEYSNLTSLTPARRIFASVTMTFFYYWAIVFQAFFVYTIFALARYPGLYREYFSAVLTASWLDVLVPMLLSLTLPFIEVSALNPAMLFQNLPKLALAFLQPLDLFSLLSLAALGAGISLFAKMSLKKTFCLLTVYLVARTLFWGALNLFFA